MNRCLHTFGKKVESWQSDSAKVHLYPIVYSNPYPYLGFMPNIKFSYLYRDGGNYKNYNSITFDNPDNIELSELENLILSKLIDGTWFYVNEWHLPDLHFNTWDSEIDHLWHEFESVEYSDEALTMPFNLKEFIVTIEKTNWFLKNIISCSLQKDIIGELFGRFGVLTKKAKDFADELTLHNAIEKNLNKQNQISREHVDNNKAVRDILLQRGVKPEALPPAEDVKKLERCLYSDEKKAAKGSK